MSKQTISGKHPSRIELSHSEILDFHETINTLLLLCSINGSEVICSLSVFIPLHHSRLSSAAGQLYHSSQSADDDSFLSNRSLYLHHLVSNNPGGGSLAHSIHSLSANRSINYRDCPEKRDCSISSFIFACSLFSA